MKSLQYIWDVQILIQFAFLLYEDAPDSFEYKNGYAIPITPKPLKNLFTATPEAQRLLDDLKAWNNEFFLYRLFYDCPSFALLLKLLADDNHRDDQGYTAILRAADQASNQFLNTSRADQERENGLRLCELLLQAGANINSRLMKTRHSRTDSLGHYFHQEAGDTPLIIATRHNCVDTVTFLVNKEANVMAKNDRGDTAMTVKRGIRFNRKILSILQSKSTKPVLFSDQRQEVKQEEPGKEVRPFDMRSSSCFRSISLDS